MKKINFKKRNGLVPAIIQDKKSGDILMLGYMNNKAFEKTLESGYVYFWSRSRNTLWKKGEKSGNVMLVNKIFLDCDNDSLLFQIDLLGNIACHSGKKSCFEIYEY